MIAPFNNDGNLPAGIHSATWTEVLTRFGTNARRRELLTGLMSGLLSLKSAGCGTVYLDGSFVTVKEHPNDSDACWDPQGVDARRLDPVLTDFSVGRRKQKMKFLGEFFPDDPTHGFIRFFQGNRDGSVKGIIKISLVSFP